MGNQSLKKNTILNMLRLALTVLVPLITFPYTSRVFLTEGTGQLNFATSVTQFFALFASLGIYTYGVREGAKLRDNREQFTEFGQELLLINVIATFFSYIVFLGCVFFLPYFKEYQMLFLIYGVTIGFTALGLDWVYGVYEDYAYITIRQIFIQLFTVIAMLIFIHDKRDLNLWAVLLVIASIVPNIFNIVHARKYISYQFKPFSSYTLQKHIKPITILFATQLASKVYLNLDTILLGVMDTDHSIGLYSAAVKLNTILITCFTAMSPVFIPRLVETLKINDLEEYQEYLKKILSMILSLAMPAVVGMEMFGDEIIVLLSGNAFAEAGMTIRILAPIVLITAVANILYYDILILWKKDSVVLKCTVIGAVVNLGVSTALIFRFHQNSVAIGSLIAETVALILAIIYCLRLGINFKKCLPNMFNYIIGCIFIVFWCLFIKIFTQNLFILLAIGIIGSVLIYFAILVCRKDYMGKQVIKAVKKVTLKFRRNSSEKK